MTLLSLGHWGVRVVSLRIAILGVGLIATLVLLFFGELCDVAAYDEGAIKVDQDGDAKRNHEGDTAPVEDGGAAILDLLLGLTGSRGQGEGGILERG